MTSEECFQAGKSEAGLDHYQVRLYPAWYRYVSTVPKGSIAALDTSAAEKAPGVVLVMTHRNAPRMKQALSPSTRRVSSDSDKARRVLGWVAARTGALKLLSGGE
jgi:CO/xanthine dehydrogenase Mo-binding subunit